MSEATALRTDALLADSDIVSVHLVLGDRTRGLVGAGAGLDVFDEEPLPAGHEFRTQPNVLATPHLGYVSELNYATFFRDAVDDIGAFLDGSPIRVLT
ncbi:hypothetical protein JNW90_20305 [Micromonospora sp. STR1s_5]|nr:hypothetical protein [Micromonospora sp. STR1s_5]